MTTPSPTPSDQMRATGSGRRRVPLPPGRSQLDWVRTSSRMQPPPPRNITPRELRNHATRDNAWLVINYSVYDVTPYIEYHPGGINMILAGAGKDATSLFNKYHSWVNVSFMLKNCYVGPYDPSTDSHDTRNELQADEDDVSERDVDTSDNSDHALASP